MKAPARLHRHGRNPVRSARFDIHAAKARLHRFYDTRSNERIRDVPCVA